MTRLLAASVLVALATVSTTAEAYSPRVQIVHLSPDAPNVDIWINGQTRLTDVPYLAATTSYKVNPNTYGLDISATGSDQPVISADLEVMDSTWYTVVAWDELASIKPAVLINDIDGLAPGNIRMQITHTAVGVGTVDLWELSTGTKLLDNVDFGATGRLDVPGGAYELGLDLDEDAVPDVTFSVPDLGSDTFVNVFAINDTDGVALFAVFPTDGTTARVDAN